jgi:hypothetical protein
MKVNEWAGSGNHNTALFWEYDVRTGRRGNLDPKPNISVSSYATFNNNPIWFSDPFGDTIIPVTATAINEDGTYKLKNGILPEGSGGAMLQALVATKTGRNYLGQFAKKGQKINDYVFKKDGKLSKYNLVILDVSLIENKGNNPVSGADGTFASEINSKGNLEFTLQVLSCNQNVMSTIESGAHEAFLHGYKASNLIRVFEQKGADAIIKLSNKSEVDHKAILLRDLNHPGYKQYHQFIEELKRAYPAYRQQIENYMEYNHKTRYVPNYTENK